VETDLNIPAYIIIAILLLSASAGAVCAYLYWKKFRNGIDVIINLLKKGQMPHSRNSDCDFIKTLSDTIRESFNENVSRIETLQRQTKELDIHIKLLGKQKNSIEDIIYSIHDVVIVSDSFDRLSMANKAAGKLFSFDVEKSKLMPMTDVLTGPGKRLVELINQSKQSKIPHVKREFTFVNEQKEGIFECLISCMFASDGEVSGIIAVLHDVTKEKEISQMKNEFVSHVSHELKTPLASINAYAEMLADGEAQDEATVKEFCSVIQSQAQRLNRLIEDILNISRIESGLVKVSKDVISLAVLIKEAVEMIKSYAAEKDITVNYDSPIIFDQVSADRDMMTQVVVNLLSNAIKYTPNGGKVSIGTEVNESEKIVRITVTDTGVGIPEEEVQLVFNKFYRVKANNKCAKGTGLGLNLVKQIVETVHNGKVFVKSKVGHGSTFGFEVPLCSSLEHSCSN
jgi:two-component system phosphate regulon sensor histidine kinase PhoR